ncbi:hypothetical protein [Oscillibacter sp.]|uniref:hypothetical protein n=1 Tax=Oscillibacter sp. TaxID=1945593 RepID=UPI002D800A81|nr:hypothetical protein [Oscillibacter sp.]
MRWFLGFTTKKKAAAFKKKVRGSICGELGPQQADYWFCVAMGLDALKYPYVVIWEE